MIRFLQKLSLEPELIEERTVQDSTYVDQVMNDHDFESLNYSLKSSKIILESEGKPYSFQKHSKCQIEDKVTLLGKSHISSLTKSQVLDDLSRTFDFSDKTEAEIALLKSKISIPSKNVLIEVNKKGSDLLKETQKVKIKDGYQGGYLDRNPFFSFSKRR